MFIEIRTYRLKNGAVPAYLGAVAEGIAIQRRHLGALVGYYSSEIGPINQIVHIWAFASLDDREARRSRLNADPEWQAFLPRIRNLIETAETKIMRPAAFSPTPPLPEAAEAEAARPDTARPDTAQPAAAQPDAARPDTA